MTVPVGVAGQGPFPFIIDTGAERSVVSRELAERLKLDPGADAKVFDFAGSSTVETAKVPLLSAGKIETGAIEAPMLMAANIGAPGMLGIDALQGRKIILDFDRKQMTLVPAKRHAGGDIIVRAQSRTGQLIVTKASFEGKPIAVIIDTGSWLSIGNSAMRALARQRPRNYGPVEVKSVTGRSFEADYVAVNDVRIGDIRIDQFNLSFADVPPFARFGLRDTPALILGMSSLQLFRRVEIDFVNREVAFTLPRPKPNFHDTCRGFSLCKQL
jgi:predicted aspartyl protease